MKCINVKENDSHGTQCCIFGARNGAGDGTGFDIISGPGCGFECGIEYVSYSKSFVGVYEGE
jgi:hypothetical protein